MAAMVPKMMTGQEQSAEISAAVAEVLAAADRDIGARRPVCRSSGRCCHFETYGHRLYVTAAELIHFSQTAFGSRRGASKKEGGLTISLPQFFGQAAPEGCPFQIDNLCTARESRPLGCRIYFCDQNAQAWQSEVYEKYHGELRALHERYNIPYRYVEWREGLRELSGQHGTT
jgi:Fe-S-cluster containining protein